jgi:predicted amidophosphoribosyltransferase
MTEEQPVSSGMKKCKYCGREIGEETNFCWYCGRELEARPERPSSPETGGNLNRWLLVTVAFVIVLALILIFLLPRF